MVRKNSIRVAEVWMDNYKSIYYERLNNRLVFTQVIINQIEKRIWTVFKILNRAHMAT